MGAGQALTAEITFQDGRAQQDNFDTYLIPRMETAPREINVHLVSSGGYDQPLGASGNRACRPSPRPSSTRYLPRRAPASAACRWPINFAAEDMS